MAWVRIDDEYGDHPKIIIAGPIASAIQTRSICYCNRHLTDGFLPDDIVPSIVAWVNSHLEKLGVPPEKRNINWPALMIKNGLWERADGGYNIHDYLDYNPTKEQVLAKRKLRETAGKKGSEKRWHDPDVDSKPDSKSHSKTIANDIANAKGGKPVLLSPPECPQSQSQTQDINKRNIPDHDTKTANPMPDSDIPPDFSKEKSDTDSPPPPPPDKIEAPEFPPDPPPRRDISIPESSRIIVKACRLKIEKKLGAITDGDVYILLNGQNGYEGFGSASRLNFAVDHITNNPDNPVRNPVAILKSFLNSPNDYLNDNEYDAWKRLRGS